VVVVAGVAAASPAAPGATAADAAAALSEEPGALDPHVLAEALAGEGVRGRDLLAALVERGIPRSLAYRLSVRHKHGGGSDEG
jgi:hypothetical protein